MRLLDSITDSMGTGLEQTPVDSETGECCYIEYGMLQSMVSHRVGQDLVTEQQHGKWNTSRIKMLTEFGKGRKYYEASLKKEENQQDNVYENLCWT